MGVTYYYRVKVCNTLGNCSSYSNVVSKNVVPAAPSISVSNYESQNILISLPYQDGVDAYEIYRSTTASGTYKRIITIENSSETNGFIDSTQKGKTYYYKVRTYKLIGDTKVYSGYSSVKKIKSN